MRRKKLTPCGKCEFFYWNDHEKHGPYSQEGGLCETLCCFEGFCEDEPDRILGRMVPVFKKWRNIDFYNTDGHCPHFSPKGPTDGEKHSDARVQ